MNDITIQYNQIASIFSRLRADIENDIKKSNYPNTLKALLICSDKIDEIGKIVQHEKINFYTSQVLSRVVFEHYLISDYIFTRSYKEKSDKVGEEYYKHYLCGEFFKRKSYSTHVDEIAKQVKKKRSQLEIIKESYSEFEKLEEKELAEINQIMNSFYNLKKIGEYLIKSEIKKSALKNFNNAKLDLVKRYSDLSSYVHGGPLAEQDFLTKSTHEKKTTIIENQDWYKLASKLSKLNLLNICVLDFGLKYLDEIKKMK